MKFVKKSAAFVLVLTLMLALFGGYRLCIDFHHCGSGR